MSAYEDSGWYEAAGKLEPQLGTAEGLSTELVITRGEEARKRLEELAAQDLLFNQFHFELFDPCYSHQDSIVKFAIRHHELMEKHKECAQPESGVGEIDEQFKGMATDEKYQAETLKIEKEFAQSDWEALLASEDWIQFRRDPDNGAGLHAVFIDRIHHFKSHQRPAPYIQRVRDAVKRVAGRLAGSADKSGVEMGKVNRVEELVKALKLACETVIADGDTSLYPQFWLNKIAELGSAETGGEKAAEFPNPPSQE